MPLTAGNSTAIERVEPTTANKGGAPGVARGAAYSATGLTGNNGSTDDCFNFAVTVRALYIQSNIVGNVFIYWGTGSSAGKFATAGDLEIVGAANAVLILPVFADWVAIACPAATIVNGTAPSGLVIFGAI